MSRAKREKIFTILASHARENNRFSRNRYLKKAAELLLTCTDCADWHSGAQLQLRVIPALRHGSRDTFTPRGTCTTLPKRATRATEAGGVLVPKRVRELRNTLRKARTVISMGAGMLFLEKNSGKREVKPTANVFATTEKKVHGKKQSGSTSADSVVVFNLVQTVE